MKMYVLLVLNRLEVHQNMKMYVLLVLNRLEAR